jgi:hypothetical protein
MKCGRLVFTGVGLLQTQHYKAANGSVGGEGGRTGEQEWRREGKCGCVCVNLTDEVTGVS